MWRRQPPHGAAAIAFCTDCFIVQSIEQLLALYRHRDEGERGLLQAELQAILAAYGTEALRDVPLEAVW